MYLCIYVCMYILFPDSTYEGRLTDWIVLWCSNSNKSSHSIFALDFDSTKDVHIYTLTINQDKPMVSDVSMALV